MKNSKIVQFILNNKVHFIALLIFLVTMFIYFQPQFSGHRLNQHDIVQYQGMANETQQFRELTGEEPLWTNSMFGGMPTYQISVKHHGNWIQKTIRIFTLWIQSPAGYFFVYMLGFYIMLLCMKVDPKVAIVGALAFAFSTYFIIILQAGHNTKALAIGFVPPVIGAFYMAFRSSIKWGILLSAFFMGVQIAANHLQITYYMGILLLGLGIAELVRVLQNKYDLKKFLITGLGLVVAYLFAMSINYGNIALTNEYAKHTIRGGNDITIAADGSSNEEITTNGLDKDYITQWSYGITEAFTFISPYIKGGASSKVQESQFAEMLRSNEHRRNAKVIGENDIYWGDQPFVSGPVYVGIVVFYLMLLGMFFLKGNMKWALFSVGLLALLLGFGENFNREHLMILNILLLVAGVILFVFKLKGKYLLFTLSILGWLLYLFGNEQMPVTNFFLDHVFGYNKFRAVTIILAVIELIIPLIGVLFIHLLIKNKSMIKEQLKAFYIISGGFAAVLVLLMFVGLGDGYMKQQERDFVYNYEDQVRSQILNENPERLLNEFGLDVNNEQQVAQVVQQQSKVINEQFDALVVFRKDVFKGSMQRSLLFLMLTIGLVYAFIKYEFNSVYLLAGLGVLVLLDLVPVNLNYLNNEKRGRNYVHWVEEDKFNFPLYPTKSDMEVFDRETFDAPDLLNDIENMIQEKTKESGRMTENEKWSRKFQALNLNTNYRVFEPQGGFSSSRSSYFHKALGGYHGAKLRRIQNLYEFQISNNNMSVLNMLNVKYIIGNQGAQVNHNALGNAWFVKEIIEKETANEELLSLGVEVNLKSNIDNALSVNGQLVNEKNVYGIETVEFTHEGNTVSIDLENVIRNRVDAAFVEDANGTADWIPLKELEKDSLNSFTTLVEMKISNIFDPSRQAIVSQTDADKLEGLSFSGLGQINMKNYQPNKMVYDVKSEGRQLAVFSEIYYPDGWKAFVNSEELEIIRVNYLLRGIVIPEGNHELEMIFEVPTYNVSNQIAMAGSILLFLLMAGAFVKDFVLKKS